MRQQHVTAAVGRQAFEARGGGRSQCFQGFVVLFGLGLQRGQAQPRDRAHLVFDALVGNPAQAGLRAIGLAFVELQLGQQQTALLCECRAGISVAKVVEDPARTLDIAGLPGAVELIEHRAGLEALLALPVGPTIPCGNRAQHQHQQPRHQVAILVPERLERVQLLLLLQVEFCGHVDV